MTEEMLPLSLRASQQDRILTLHRFAGSLFVAEEASAELVDRLLAEIRRLLDADSVVLALETGDGHIVGRHVAGKGAGSWLGKRWPAREGVLGRVMLAQEPVLTNEHLGDGDQWPFDRPTANGVFAPIARHETAIGVIWAVRPIGDRFFSADLELLNEAARILSWAMILQDTNAEAGNARVRLQHLFEDGFDPVLLTDADGRIVSANRQAEAFFAAEPGALVTTPLSELHADRDGLPEWDAVPADRTLTFRGRIWSAAGAGTAGAGNRVPSATRPVEVRVRRLLTTPAETWQWIYHDMTSQEELEQMRQDLTAMLVHDLQSPLGNVISSLELIRYSLMQRGDSEATLDLLDVASRSSDQLLRLIQSLLDISRLEAGQPLGKRKPADVGKLIRDAYEIEQPNFERRGVRLIQELAPGLPAVDAEENVLSRVLLNLFDNALKHSGEGYTITVSAGLQSDGMVLFSVCDEGIGIPEDFRETIFEKFQRIKTDPSSKGLGLGLAFCRLAVEAHGGRIWVEESPAGGARFNFTIPAAKADPTSETTTPAAA
jgi:signal transduction histidine kinase